MSNEFMREEHYIVFKMSDVVEHFTTTEAIHLARLYRIQRVGRKEAGKSKLECVVVEKDWPEYEPTRQAIEARVTGAQPAPSFADAYQGAMEEAAIWKKRALEAEDLNRKFIAEINGPTHMGEPAQPAPSVPTESIGKMLAQVMEAAVANGANSVSMPDELVEVAAWLSGAQPNPANGQTRAVRDVIAERRRQIEVEGWAPDHDDRHGAHELAEAAACYCLSSAGKPFDYFETMWPWERWWFKVSDPRRDLVKAGALVLAEIERLDRAAAPKPDNT